MERPVYIDENIIKKNKPRVFPFQMVLKDVDVTNEYLISGEWTGNKPQQKPEGKRLVFANVEQLRIARDVYFIWEELELQKQTDPAIPEEIIKRLLVGRSTGQTVNLFVPWGVRPEGEPKLETSVLDKIQNVSDMMRKKGVNSQVILMPADIYATEINLINCDLAFNYFCFVRREAEARGFVVKSWSEIRAENIDLYQSLAAQYCEETLEEILPGGVIERAIEAAKRRSCRTDINDIIKSAYTYLGERIVEAEIIERIYKPIKVSAVSKNKDGYVDRELPRLYLVPEEMQFPWLK